MVDKSRAPRGSRGAIYTACFGAFVIPLVVMLVVVVLQAAVNSHEQARLRFVGQDVLEHFDSLPELD